MGVGWGARGGRVRALSRAEGWRRVDADVAWVLTWHSPVMLTAIVTTSPVALPLLLLAVGLAGGVAAHGSSVGVGVGGWGWVSGVGGVDTGGCQAACHLATCHLAAGHVAAGPPEPALSSGAAVA